MRGWVFLPHAHPPPDLLRGEGGYKNRAGFDKGACPARTGALVRGEGEGEGALPPSP